MGYDDTSYLERFEGFEGFVVYGFSLIRTYQPFFKFSNSQIGTLIKQLHDSTKPVMG